MPISPLPAAPSRSQSPASFATTADAFLGRLSTFAAEATALEQAVNEAEIVVVAAEATAIAAKNAAQAAAAVSTAGANFKGLWESLTGPLEMPASVLHNDSFWVLLETLVDVTADEPGVSAKWAGTSGVAELKTSNFTALTGGDYILAPGVTMTLPANPTVGQRVTFRAAGDISAIMADMPIVARNGNDIQGIDEDVQINGQGSVTLIWAGADQGGWV